MVGRFTAVTACESWDWIADVGDKVSADSNEQPADGVAVHTPGTDDRAQTSLSRLRALGPDEVPSLERILG
jgi:hypothetical protein